MESPDVLPTAPIQPVVALDITSEEQARVFEAAAARRAPSTRRTYERSWARWSTWCAGRRAPAMPALPELVCVWITGAAADGRALSTIDGMLAAISAAHRDQGLRDPAQHPGVVAVRAGLRRQIGTAPRKQSHPLTTGELRRMIDEIESTSLKGLRDRAILLIGYGAALRRSEIGALDIGDVTVRPKGLLVTIGSSKADQEMRGQIVGIARGHRTATDPVAALMAWFAAAGIDDPVTPLFRRIAWSDRRPLERRLSGQAIGEIVQARAVAAGLGDLPVSGHSLRAGHCTTAAEAGVSAEQLARTTRHKDLGVLAAAYIRPAVLLDDTSSRFLDL